MTGGTDRCGCSEERLLCGSEACDATHPDGRYVCTKVSGHDGPHAACSPSEHPAVSWPSETEQAKLIADGGLVDDDTDHPQKAWVGCAYCGVYANIEITDKDEDPDAEVQYCPNCGKPIDVLEVHR